MKKSFTLILLIISGLSIVAQQQLQNASFENWEEIGFGPEILEPVNWSAIKSSDNISLNAVAPVVCEKSTDARTGNYSAKLTNIATLGIVATGTMTNGRLHADLNPDLGYAYTDPADGRWNTPFTGKPDSVVGWFKADPSIDDFGTIKFLLHKGEASIPGPETNYIAMAQLDLPPNGVNQWTRFSAAFVYTSDDTPQYILSIVTSGNGTNAVGGSTALFDDFELIYNGSSINELNILPLEVYQAGEKLLVLFPANVQNNLNLKITNINGQIMLNSSFDRQSSCEIDITGYNPGLYIVTATGDNNMYMNKVMIIK